MMKKSILFPLMLGAMLLASCSSSHHIEIRTVALPPECERQPHTVMEVICAATAKGAVSHKWKCSVAKNGEFHLDEQKPVSYVSEYSEDLKPVAKDTRMVGIKVDGKIRATSSGGAAIKIAVHHVDHVGFNRYEEGRVLQPVFVTRDVSTVRAVPGSGWCLLASPPGPDATSYRYYLLAILDGVPKPAQR